MKGTIDANQPNAKANLLNDEKEQREHYTIVDLMRNDLSMVAKTSEYLVFATSIVFTQNEAKYCKPVQKFVVNWEIIGKIQLAQY